MATLSVPEPWTRVASGYARGLHHHLAHYACDTRALLAPRRSDRVLDVGCGSGAATLAFAPMSAHVTAVDFSPGMVQALRHTLRAAGTCNVTVLHGDGQALDLPDAHADLAIAMFSLIFFPDRAAGLSELWRCLRPGGRVAVSCWPPMADSPALSWMSDGFAAGFPELPAPTRTEGALDTPEALHAELTAAGFTEVAVHPLSHDIVVDDVETFWREMCASSAPLSLLRDQYADEDWFARHRAAVAYLHERAKPGLRLAMPAYVGVGTRPG